MHIAERFEVLLGAYPRPDGRAWSGQQIDEATGGVVTRSYVTNLRKGRIENPGYRKLQAIAQAIGFPPRLWFDEDLCEAPSGQARLNIDQDLDQILRDGTVNAIARKSSRLPIREKRMVLRIVEQFESVNEPSET